MVQSLPFFPKIKYFWAGIYKIAGHDIVSGYPQSTLGSLKVVL